MICASSTEVFLLIKRCTKKNLCNQKKQLMVDHYFIPNNEFLLSKYNNHNLPYYCPFSFKIFCLVVIENFIKK